MAILYNKNRFIYIQAMSNREYIADWSDGMEILNNISLVLQIITNVCITLYTIFLQFWSENEE